MPALRRREPPGSAILQFVRQVARAGVIGSGSGGPSRSSSPTSSTRQGWGERLDPETSHVLTDYFEGVKPVVERHGGVLAKFIGDAVMAVFGLTELHEDDALRAVRTAVEMRETLVRLNEHFEQRYGVVLATRTGINTGTVAGKGLVPDRNFVAGDTANTAARLQQTAEPGEIILSESAYRLVRVGRGRARLAPLELKGKQSPVGVYRLIGVLAMAEPAPRLDAPLVGRQDMLAQLDWALERAVAERSCRLVSILGAAGIGKSRLVHEFVARLGEQATVVRGRCLPYGEGITFWPLAAMVKQAAGIREGDGADDAVAKLATVLEPDADARTVAETIAQLTGLREREAQTRPCRRSGSKRKASGPSVRSSGDSREVGRSSPCSTTPSGQSRHSSRSSNTWRGTRPPYRCSCSASAGQSSSSATRAGARSWSEARH